MEQKIEKALELYTTMLLIRRVEERIVAEYPRQEIRCPTHLSIGQEAAAVGVCAALRREDVVFSTHRCHAHYLAKGGDLNRMVAELYGKVTGCARGKGGSMHLVDPSVGMLGSSAIVGGSIPIAAGSALSFKMRREPRVAVAFFGDGATEEGVFTETLAIAALKNLPLVLACENNLYATLSHISGRQCSPIFERTKAYGVPSVRVDGNDVTNVLRAAQEAADRARSDGGPTLLEMMTYRWLAHVGPEPDTGKMCRTPEELAYWKDRCPLKRQAEELIGAGVDHGELEGIERRVMAKIDAAFEAAKIAAPPHVNELLMHIGDEVDHA